MDWQSLVKANAAIRTTNIKGKEYAEVNQRVKAFRTLYPEGFITTEILCREGGLCIIRATVGHYTDGKSVILATGTAYEKEGSSQINRTSYIENCETSAVGRALGMAGFGIDTSIASADEMNNALLQQNPNTVQKPVQAAPHVQKPVQAEQTAPYDILQETAADSELRLKWLGKYGEKALDASCRKKFGTGFAQTPIDKIKAVMPQE
jgi:hypothetical protein